MKCEQTLGSAAPPGGAACAVFENDVFGVEHIADAVGFGPVFIGARLFALRD
jgi:hypothetical protein